MQKNEIRKIRQGAGLTLNGMARLIRIKDLSAVHKWEKGTRQISGPVSILLEMIERGELPDRYYFEAGLK